MLQRDMIGGAQGEIDLVDLWLFLNRYWKLLVVSVVISVLLAGIYLWLRKPVYEYLTLVEIGTQIVDEQIILIESPESVQTKLLQGYLPDVWREHYSTRPDDEARYDIAVSVPKDSDMVLVATEGPQSAVEEFRVIHAELLARLIADHNRIIDVIRQSLKTRIVKAEAQLDALLSGAELLKAEQSRLAERQQNLLIAANERIELNQRELARLEEEHRHRLAMLDEQLGLRKIELSRQAHAERLLDEQILELENLLVRVREDENQALREVTDEARAMTMLLIHNQVQQAGRQLAELRERRDVRIPNERSRLEKEIQDLEKQRDIALGEMANTRERLTNELGNSRRQLADQKNEWQAERDRLAESIAASARDERVLRASIEELTMELENMKQTRALSVAAESVKPTGPAGPVLVVIAMMLASLFGLMIAAAHNVARVARERAAGGAEPKRLAAMRTEHASGNVPAVA